MKLKDVKFKHESNNLNTLSLYFEPADKLSVNDAKVETEKFTEALENVVKKHYSAHDFVFSKSATGKYTDDCLGFVNNRVDYCLKSHNGEFFRTSINNSIKLSPSVDCVNFVKFSSYGNNREMMSSILNSVKELPIDVSVDLRLKIHSIGYHERLDKLVSRISDKVEDARKSVRGLVY